jgi:triacylglycerol lipase
MKNKTTVLLVLFAFSLLTTAVLTVQVASIPAVKASDEVDDAVIVDAVEEVAPEEAGAWDNPIILVHGFIGGYGLTPWYKLKDRLVSWGCPRSKIFEMRFKDAIFASNVQNAKELRDYVNYVLAVTASKVDLIGHSMGGLSTRYYIKYLGGASKVDDYVSLGSPHHGTLLAIIPLAYLSIGALEMRPGSSFLNSLNSGDETPGNVHYTCIYAYMDELVQPYWSAKLSGATNKGKWWVGHIGLLFDYTVAKWTRDAVKY